ncbi:MAG: hypothetical protein ACYCW6_29295 [Candidatus Xenobia bacterium]
MVIHAARAFPGDSQPLSRLAQADAALAEGGTPGRFTSEQSDALKELSIAVPQRLTYHRDLATAARFYALPAAVGAGLSYAAVAATPLAPLAPVFAVAGGAVTALIRHQSYTMRYSGPAEVTIDGETRRDSWKSNLSNFAQSPEEMRQRLLAEGKLGDDIPSANANVTGAPLSDAPANQVLQKLEGARRLVADLGTRSRYGHDVLNSVSALQASQMLAAGKSVFVVDGDSAVTTPHVYRTAARSLDKHLGEAHSLAFTERSFHYGLTPLHAAADLAGVKNAAGLPSGIDGVYAHGDEVSQIVLRQSQDGKGTVFDNGAEVTRADASNRGNWSTGDATVRPGQQPQVALGKFRNHAGNASYFGFMLGAVGGIALMSATGSPLSALAVCGLGTFLGRAVGNELDAKDSGNQPVVTPGL